MSSRRAEKTISVEAFLLAGLINALSPRSMRTRSRPLTGYTMQQERFHAAKMFALLFASLLCASCNLSAQMQASEPQIQTSDLNQQIGNFLQGEVRAHVSDIKPLAPPPTASLAR